MRIDNVRFRSKRTFAIMPFNDRNVPRPGARPWRNRPFQDAQHPFSVLQMRKVRYPAGRDQIKTFTSLGANVQVCHKQSSAIMRMSSGNRPTQDIPRFAVLSQTKPRIAVERSPFLSPALSFGRKQSETDSGKLPLIDDGAVD